jgi:hypothetical protein
MQLLPIICYRTWGKCFRLYVHHGPMPGKRVFLFKFVGVVSAQVGSCGCGWCGDSGVVDSVLLCFIEPIVGGMGPGASSRDCYLGI